MSQSFREEVLNVKLAELLSKQRIISVPETGLLVHPTIFYSLPYPTETLQNPPEGSAALIGVYKQLLINDT